MIREWWNKRSKGEKILIGIGGVAAAVLTGYGLYSLGKHIGSSIKCEEMTKSLNDAVDKGIDIGFDKGVSDPVSNLSMAKTHAYRAGLKEGVITGRFQELYNFTEPNLGNPDQEFLLKHFGTKLVKVSKEEAEAILNCVDPIKEMENFLRNQIKNGRTY